MRFFIFLVLTFLSVYPILAQDVIIKTSGEEIKCRILEIKEGYISYQLEDSDKTNWLFKNEIREVIKKEQEKKEVAREYTTDVIVTTDGESMEVEIGQISEDYVEYKIKTGNGVVEMRMNRDDIKEIYKNSKANIESSNYEFYEEPERFVIKNFSEIKDAHRNNLKTSFSGLGNGSLIMGYERAVSLRWRSEILVHSHGIGIVPKNVEKSGLGVSLGMKYRIKPPIEDKELADSHYLHGAYVKGNLGFSSVNEQVENFNSEFKFENINRTYMHAGTDVGYQWVFSNRLTMDVFLGLNFIQGDFENTVSENGVVQEIDSYDFEDGDLYGGSTGAVTAGLHLGYLFSFKKNK